MSGELPPELEALPKLRRVGSGWMACCPLHDDTSPSLSITTADSGKLLVHCHAGCDQAELAEMLGLRGQDRHAEWTPHGDAIAVYDYRDETGRVLYQVLRTADKAFPQRRPDPTARSGWRWNLGDVRRVLFRLPELIEAVGAGQTIYVTEGEKDALALVARGKVATCNPGGAGKWRPEFASFLAGATVIVCADKDRAGQAHARAVAASLQAVDATVWVVEAADPHKDISDHLGAGLPPEQVNITHRPVEAAAPDLAPTLVSLLAAGLPAYDWLIPGLMERGERFMLTGAEGLGKSMWLRMLAVCLACGIQPLTFDWVEPLNVLYIDCENSERQNLRNFRPMVEATARHGRPLGDSLRLIQMPNGINLPSENDAAWLLERVTAHRPDVLFIGPLYRLHLDNPNDEETARRVVAAVDAARNHNNCAVFIEAHSGHADGGSRRPLRPVGSSLYLRWPEFGFGMRRVNEDDETDTRVTLRAWRGARDERAWPRQVRRAIGTGWPWEPDVDGG